MFWLLDSLPCKNQNKSLTLSYLVGKFKFAVWFSTPSHLYNIKHRSLNITWIVSCNFCAYLSNFSFFHLFIKDENDIDGTEQHDLLKIETLHWLLYDPSQLDEALERANLLIRYYILSFFVKAPCSILDSMIFTNILSLFS